MSDWIRVKDIMPEDGRLVSVLYTSARTCITGTCIAYHTQKGWYTDDDFVLLEEPTHWRPKEE